MRFLLGPRESSKDNDAGVVDAVGGMVPPRRRRSRDGITTSTTTYINTTATLAALQLGPVVRRPTRSHVEFVQLIARTGGDDLATVSQLCSGTPTEQVREAVHLREGVARTLRRTIADAFGPLPLAFRRTLHAGLSNEMNEGMDPSRGRCWKPRLNIFQIFQADLPTTRSCFLFHRPRNPEDHSHIVHIICMMARWCWHANAMRCDDTLIHVHHAILQSVTAIVTAGAAAASMQPPTPQGYVTAVGASTLSTLLGLYRSGVSGWRQSRAAAVPASIAAQQRLNE